MRVVRIVSAEAPLKKMSAHRSWREDNYPVVLRAAMVHWMHPKIRPASLIELMCQSDVT
jgi:hypothetical protein